MGFAVSLIAKIIVFALNLYLLALLARIVLDLIPSFNRDWRPQGFGLVLAEIVYTITDPPLKFFRRFIPPLRLGPVAIDLSFTVTFILCLVLITFVGVLGDVLAG